MIPEATELIVTPRSQPGTKWAVEGVLTGVTTSTSGWQIQLGVTSTSPSALQFSSRVFSLEPASWRIW